MENEEYDTIDLLEVLNAVRQHIAVLILCTLATAIAGFAITHFLITPQYESSALMIVNTRQDTTSTVTSDQINSATKLVSTYSIIIKSDTVLQQVIDDLGLSLSYSDLKGRVTVSAVDDTQVMKITVRSNNPEWARQVCDDITAVSPDVGAILLQVILDNKINTEEDVAKYLDMTVVGVIPVYEGGKNK